MNFSQNLIDFLRFRCSLIGCTQNFLATNWLLVFSLITEYRIKIILIYSCKKDRYQALISKSILQLFPLQLSFFKKILSIYIIANQFIVKVLKSDSSVIPNHSVYSLNMERIIMRLHHD